MFCSSKYLISKEGASLFFHMATDLRMFIIRRDNSLNTVTLQKSVSQPNDPEFYDCIKRSDSCIFLSASRLLNYLKQTNASLHWKIFSYLWIPNSLLHGRAYRGKSGNVQRPLEFFLASPSVQYEVC